MFSADPVETDSHYLIREGCFEGGFANKRVCIVLEVSLTRQEDPNLD